MSAETIFFSYSRDDSEFVLNLAKNLRNAGANIWLDQLDIKPGTRWDKSIEDALDASNTLLVILSKTSVESTNVMDEVSFALEENKIVVPVLLEKCDIPFRIRRLQFADFSTDKVKGLKTLAEALHLDYSVASKLTETAKAEPAVSKKEVLAGKKIKEEVEAKKKEVKQEKPQTQKEVKKPSDPKATAPKIEKKSKNKMPLFIIGGLIVVLGAVGFFMKDSLFPDKDQIAWDLALSKDEIKEYEFYKRSFPEGKYATTAQDSINSKKFAIEKQKEIDAWTIADNAKSVSGYEAYLKEYEDGPHSEEARNLIKELNNNIEKVNADNAAYEAAENDGTINVLASYVSNGNVLGAHKDEAVAKIMETGKEHWIFYGRPKNDRMVDLVFDLHFRSGASVEADMIPEIGDILIATKPYSTYLRVGATEAEGRSGHALKVGNKVLVVAKDERATATFVKIRYD
jgi:hypothetical protein